MNDKKIISIKVYNIREKEVVLDSDLATAYNYETKYLNRQVERNKDKFINNSYFRLTNEEYEHLRCQNVTSSLTNYGGRRYLPYVFTKEGIEVLNTILKTPNKEIITKNILKKFISENNNISLIKPEKSVKIEDMIYEIRGLKVMLDEDIATLFGYTTKELNRNVKNNISRFPESYCFKLTEEEYSNLRCKIFTSSLKNYGGRRYLPLVYTEYGVTMLAGILKSDVAVKASISIVNAFINMRRFISSELLEQKYLKELIFKNREDIRLLKEAFSKFQNKEEINTIFFEGEIYDAYSKLIDIMNKAQEELIIIDNYADKTVLDMIKNLKINVILITKNNNKLKPLDITKYQEEYHNLKIIYSTSFHDRYLILDKKTIYHCGASLNHAGAKTFSLNKLEEEFIINLLITKINNIINDKS